MKYITQGDIKINNRILRNRIRDLASKDLVEIKKANSFKEIDISF